MPAPSGVTCLDAWGVLLDPAGLARRAGGSAEEPPGSLLARRYRQVGLRVAGEIAGSLCAVLWDGERRRLVALRDRMGLGGGPCWAVEGERLVLAPRPAQLAGALERPARPDLTSLLLHLHGRGPLPGSTFYQGVSEVPPGAWLLAAPDGVEVRRYWSVDPGDGDDDDRKEAEAAEELRAVLEAVGRDWAAPGRAAVSLSGGVDSPSIAAAVRRSTPAERLTAVHHTTPRLETAGESGLARETARHLGIRLRLFDGMDRWPLREADGPLTGPDSPYRSPYTEVWQETFRLAAEEGAGDLFTGSGGDHLFAGPGAYGYADLLSAGSLRELARRWRRHPPPRPSARRIVAAALHAGLDPRLVASRHRVPWLLRRRRGEWRRAYAALQPSRRSPSRRELALSLRDDMVPVIVSALAELGRPYGLELRHPFFDHRLVELAARLPSDAVARDGVRKRVLRAAVRPWLPAALVDRREKIFPVEILLRGLRERETHRVWPLLTGMRAADAGLVDETRLRRGYRSYLAGGSDFRFWHAVTLESWLRHWF